MKNIFFGKNGFVTCVKTSMLLVFILLNVSCQLQSQESEREVFATPGSAWDDDNFQTEVSFVSANKLFNKYDPPSINKIDSQWNAKAWRGEKIHTQVLVWSQVPVENVTMQISPLKNDNGQSISPDNIQARFIGYTIADGMDAKVKGCGMEPGQDSLLVADVLKNENHINIEAKTTQPVWLSVNIPKDAPEGVYKGNLKVDTENGTNLKTLDFSVEVSNRVLPDPEDWEFHLDLWQSPDAIARVHNVEKWSDEHFKVMEPYMKSLADAGQKVITTTLIKDPWNSQTLDIYDSMIEWRKKKDGTWTYDYTVFDRYVSFMESLGIDKLIEGYSMIPWNLKFYYYDENLGEETHIVAEPGSKEYKEHWDRMLNDFARHLKE